MNDDCFNVWNFSCNCFFIWSSIFLYLMIKSCNIFFMKIDIMSKKIYDFAKTRIASFILSILWEILTISFFFVCIFHICFIIFLLIWNQFMKLLNKTKMWSCSKNCLICHQIICYWLWIKIFNWKMINFEKNFLFKFFHIIIRIYILSHFDLQN